MAADAHRHLVVLAAVAALAVPVMICDWFMLAPSGGGWISIDFRGLFIGTFGVLYAAFALLSSGRWALARRGVEEPTPLPSSFYAAQTGWVILAAVVLLVGYLSINKVLSDRRGQASEQSAQALSGDISLRWLASTTAPSHTYVELTNSGSGNAYVAEIKVKAAVPPSTHPSSVGMILQSRHESQEWPLRPGEPRLFKVPLDANYDDATDWRIWTKVYRENAWANIAWLPLGEQGYEAEGALVPRALPDPSPGLGP